MKKALAILLVLLVAGVAFGANDASTNLYLQTAVGDQFGVVITTPSADPTNKLEFAELTPVGTSGSPIVFTDTALSKSLEVHLMTNKNSAYTVTVLANPMIASGVTTKIGYTVTPLGGSTFSVLSSSSDVPITLNSIVATAGLRFSSKEFTIAMSKADWDLAESGTYSTTWTVNLATN